MKKQKVTFSRGKDDINSFSLTSKDFENYISELLYELERPHDKEVLDDYREQLLETYFTYRFVQREYNWKMTKSMKQLEPYILLHIKDKGLSVKVIA